MNHKVRFHRNSAYLGCLAAPVQPSVGHVPAVQTHSSPCPKHLPSGQPHIAQRKQRYQLCRVLGQPFVANLGETELVLDRSERVLDLCASAGCKLLGVVQQATPRRALVQCPSAQQAGSIRPATAAGQSQLISSRNTCVRLVNSSYLLVARLICFIFVQRLSGGAIVRVLQRFPNAHLLGEHSTYKNSR